MKNLMLTQEEFQKHFQTSHSEWEEILVIIRDLIEQYRGTPWWLLHMEELTYEEIRVHHPELDTKGKLGHRIWKTNQEILRILKNNPKIKENL